MKKIEIEKKMMFVGTIGSYLYGFSIIFKRNTLNIGIALMVLASLFFIKKIDLKKMDKIQKLFFILILFTPLFDLISKGGVNSALISIQKSYRFLPLFLVPIFINNYEKLKKFLVCINFSVMISCIYVLNIYRNLGWNFGMRYEDVRGAQETSHCLAGLSYIILYSLVLAYKKREKFIFGLASIVYPLSLGILFVSRRRGAWLSLIFSMILLIGLNFNKKMIKKVFLIGVLLIGIGYLNRENIQNNIYYKRMVSIKDTEKDGSNKTRLMLWKASYNIFKENLPFGVGKDNSPKYFLEYFEKNQEYVNRNLGNDHSALKKISTAGNPHSMYFDNLVNMGVFFFYWLGMMGYIFLLQLKETVTNKKNSVFFLNVISSCITLSYLITGVFESAWGDFFRRHMFLVGLILFISGNKILKNYEKSEEKEKN